MNQYQSGLINRIDSTLDISKFQDQPAKLSYVQSSKISIYQKQKFLQLPPQIYSVHLIIRPQLHVYCYVTSCVFKTIAYSTARDVTLLFFVSCVKFSRGTRTHIHFSFYHHFLPILCCYFKNIIFCLPPALSTSWAETRVAV